MGTVCSSSVKDSLSAIAEERRENGARERKRSVEQRKEERVGENERVSIETLDRGGNHLKINYFQARHRSRPRVCVVNDKCSLEIGASVRQDAL